MSTRLDRPPICRRTAVRPVCPWHQAAYDVHSGRMVRGPQGVFAKVPGLGAAYKALTSVLPLRRGTVLERDGRLFVR